MNGTVNGLIARSVFWLGLLLAAAAMPAAAEMAMTRVVAVEGDAVTLEAGTEAGLGKGAVVTLLREGEPIVHPLTGAVLGMPQEPVGVLEVIEVGPTSGRGVLTKIYSPPMVGDMAEYAAVEVMMAPPAAMMAPPAAVGEVTDRVGALEKTLRQYQKSNKVLKTYPAFAEQVWDEIMAMRSHMLSVDERLIDLEEQQGADRLRLAALASGDFHESGMEEFTIRYMPGTDVRLRIAGKTLVITVDQDSTYHLQEIDPATDPALMMLEAVEETDESTFDLEVWITENSDYLMYSVVGLFVLVALYIISLVLRNRQNDDLEEDEFDEDFLDEEEDE